MILYTNARGYPVNAHSYSGSSEYGDCPQKYDYSRRKGWKEKEQRASSAFGSALESAIQYFHANDLSLPAGKTEWERLWELQKNNTELVYSDKDGDWETMLQQGLQMLKLYARILPTLPIAYPTFQVNYKKELYPDTEYVGLQFTSFVDMETEAVWNHPLLPPIERPENGRRTVIIDIKTAGNPYLVDPRMASMDPQLRAYAWATGHETVAFLVFVKRALSIEKGDTVTLINWWTEQHPVGEELTVLKTEGDTLTLLSPSDYEQYEVEAKGLRGNALKAKVNEFAERLGVQVLKDEVTKQRIQFLAAVVSEQDRLETGEVLGQQAIQISEANDKNFFPKRPGVRFPNNHCSFCSYLGLCIKDDQMVREKLVNITMPQQKETDWLEEI